MFTPVSTAWQKRMAEQLALPAPTKHIWARAKITELPRRRPEKLINVDGDGNCLPRAISVAITGREDHYNVLRQKVVNFLRMRGENVDQIQADKAWMTEREIEGFALLLGVPIYSCAEGSPGNWRYFRYPHQMDQQQPVDHDGAIFIANIPSNQHFQVVLKP